MQTILISVVAFCICIALVYNLPKIIKFVATQLWKIIKLLAKGVSTVVCFPFVLISIGIDKIKEKRNPKYSSEKTFESPKNNYATQNNDLELQNLRQQLQNAQNIISQNNYEIARLRSELANMQSSKQSNSLAFTENNIVSYLRSLENDTRRIEFCHNTIKTLKQISINLQSGQG